MRIRNLSLALLVVGALSGAAHAKDGGLSAEAVNNAAFEELKGEGPTPAMLRAQILLDRARFSPGQIDGLQGSNTERAIKAFAKANDLGSDGKLTKEVFEKLVSTSSGPVIEEYKITKDDVDGPFTKEIPDEMEAMAKLKRVGYQNAEELLGEKFHSSPELLKQLNPGKSLDKAGETILVPKVAQIDLKKGQAGGSKAKVDKVEVDKAMRAVRAYDKSGKLVASYPASIGSEETPAPEGTRKVKAVAAEPNYTYNPEYKFKGVEAKEKFTIPPGANNPVGLIWIDLGGEGYGIHGTPDPAKVGKTFSHGCIRLTNWDAQDLAGMIEKGATVKFLE